MNDTTNPISESGPWTLGTLIWFPVGILITLAFAYATKRLWRAWRDEDGCNDAVEFLVFTICAGVATVLAGLLTALSMWPYDSEFHQWRTVSGEVEQVESRLIADGDGMSERYVVTIEGRPFGVDDTRAALLSEGDEVSLRCKREWQYAADSGWGCRWGKMAEDVR